jgi:hypothetical protein
MSLLFLLLPLDLIGAAMAFLISYDELQRHARGSRYAALEAARRAAFAFAYLIALSVVIVLILTRANG